MIFEGNYNFQNQIKDQKESNFNYSNISPILTPFPTPTSTPLSSPKIIERTSSNKNSNTLKSIILSIENDFSYKINIGVNTIGRSSTSSISLKKSSKLDTSVTSRKHCTIYYDNFGLRITSNSLNGLTKIYRNGCNIYLRHNQISPLYVGETIQIGHIKAKINYGISNNPQLNFESNDNNENGNGISVKSQQQQNNNNINNSNLTLSNQEITTKSIYPPNYHQTRIHHVRHIPFFYNKKSFSSSLSSSSSSSLPSEIKSNTMKKVSKKLTKKKTSINSLSSLFDKINIGSSVSNNHSDVDQNEIYFGEEQQELCVGGFDIENENQIGYELK
ncbi:hypothetical protein ACTFIW_004072 [Dictyostelium discoideum]